MSHVNYQSIYSANDDNNYGKYDVANTKIKENT